jgi:TonB family protein
MTPDTERFSYGLTASVILHGALVALLLFGGALFPSAEPWGKETGKGGIVQVSLGGREGILLPPKPLINPGAPPSDSPGWQPEPVKAEKAPAKPKPTKSQPNETKATKTSSNKGIPIPDREAPTKPSAPSSNQIASAAVTPVAGPSGPASSSASPAATPVNAVDIGNGGTPSIMYGQVSNGAGTASVGFSESSFGKRFSWYADALTAAVSKYWTPAPAAMGTPRIYVVFVINKDGSVTNVEFERKSNNDALDNSARRAILQAAGNKLIPPLPSEYRESSIKARLSFEYIVR